MKTVFGTAQHAEASGSRHTRESIKIDADENLRSAAGHFLISRMMVCGEIQTRRTDTGQDNARAGSSSDHAQETQKDSFAPEGSPTTDSTLSVEGKIRRRLGRLMVKVLPHGSRRNLDVTHFLLRSAILGDRPHGVSMSQRVPKSQSGFSPHLPNEIAASTDAGKTPRRTGRSSRSNGSGNSESSNDANQRLNSLRHPLEKSLIDLFWGTPETERANAEAELFRNVENLLESTAWLTDIANQVEDAGQIGFEIKFGTTGGIAGRLDGLDHQLHRYLELEALAYQCPVPLQPIGFRQLIDSTSRFCSQLNTAVGITRLSTVQPMEGGGWSPERLIINLTCGTQIALNNCRINCLRQAADGRVVDGAIDALSLAVIKSDVTLASHSGPSNTCGFELGFKSIVLKSNTVIEPTDCCRYILCVLEKEKSKRAKTKKVIESLNTMFRKKVTDSYSPAKTLNSTVSGRQLRDSRIITCTRLKGAKGWEYSLNLPSGCKVIHA